jgi:hypothetical protein
LKETCRLILPSLPSFAFHAHTFHISFRVSSTTCLYPSLSFLDCLLSFLLMLSSYSMLLSTTCILLLTTPLYSTYQSISSPSSIITPLTSYSNLCLCLSPTLPSPTVSQTVNFIVSSQIFTFLILKLLIPFGFQFLSNKLLISLRIHCFLKLLLIIIH